MARTRPESVWRRYLAWSRRDEMNDGRCAARSFVLALLVTLACNVLLGCGGGAGKGDGADADSGGVSSGGGNGGGGGGGTTPPPPPTGLTGGVLATFQSGAETFNWWVTEPTAAQRLPSR